MMNFYQQGLSMMQGSPLAGVGMLLSLVLVVWSLYWKGMSMWKAATRGDRNWFIALLILNTAGILDILYIYVFSKKKEEATPAPEVKQ